MELEWLDTAYSVRLGGRVRDDDACGGCGLVDVNVSLECTPSTAHSKL